MARISKDWSHFRRSFGFPIVILDLFETQTVETKLMSLCIFPLESWPADLIRPLNVTKVILHFSQLTSWSVVKSASHDLRNNSMRGPTLSLFLRGPVCIHSLALFYLSHIQHVGSRYTLFILLRVCLVWAGRELSYYTRQELSKQLSSQTSQEKRF